MIDFRRKGTVDVPRLNCIYKGKVADNNDPERRGRLRIIVPSVLGEKTQTTWACPKNISTGAFAGSFDIPTIGATVWVQFEDGNPSLPVWEAGWPISPPGSTGPQIPKEALEDYPNTKVYATPSGHKLVYRSKSNATSLEILSPSGHSVLLDDTNQTVKVSSAQGHSVAMDDKNKNVIVASEGGHTITLDDTARTATLRTAGGQSIQLNQAAQTATVSASTVGLGGTYANLPAANNAITAGDLTTYNNAFRSMLLTAFQNYTNLLTTGGAFNNDGGSPGTVLAGLIASFLGSFTLPTGSGTTRIK